MRCKDQVAIVTGGASGIGKAVCKRLVEEGAKVVLNDIDGEMVDELALALGESVVPIAGDCSQIKVIENLVDKAVDHFGKVDIAFANAGITSFGEFITFDRQNFDRLMEVNLAGTYFLAQKCAQQMIKQGIGGKILFMSSVTGHTAHQNLAAYGMSKAAIEMLAKHLVVELSAHNITVNAIAPGATLTERTRREEDYEQTWSKITPMGRAATVDDIADTAIFLASDEAKHITGQTIIIDGGWTSVSIPPY